MSLNPAIPAAVGSEAPLAERGRRPVFAAAYVTAALVTALGVALVTWAPAGRPISDLSRMAVALLGLNLLLILGLAVWVGWRVLRLIGARRDPGVRLHLRFVTLFATAAVVPAILVALVFGLLVTRGVESWFSTRVESVVENFRRVANAYIDQQEYILNVEVAALAEDLNRVALLETDQATFEEFLRLQAERRELDAIYILGPGGRRITGVETPGAPKYQPPDPSTWRAAQQQVLIDTNRAQQALTGLVRLEAYADAYVYAVDLNREVFTRLIEAEQAVDEYSSARDNRERIGAIFTLSYAETALLVLVGAVWLGMSAATRIAAPVGRLVQAADRVAGGDLDARVQTRGDPEEIAVLSRAFNRMTEDLQAQQQALRAAGEEAESRRNFIETVLSRVSAGVVGVDAQGRVSAANEQALSLLQLEDAEARGRTVAEIAPELAPVLARACSTKRDAEDEIDLVRGGESRRLRLRASGADEAGLVLTFDDITRLVAAQRNAAWRDVARRIAHEIKNPLTPIQLSAERLRRKFRREITADLETFDRCTDTIIRQVGDIGRMVDEFSAFARMPAPKYAREDAAELLRQAVFAQRVASPDLDVSLEEPTPEIAITCDGRMIAQALANVLKNAAEAVGARRDGDPAHGGRILARLKLVEGDAVFEVEDDGVGLPSRDRERLTEPYVTTREKGTGLGLAIVKRIMEDHGGTLALGDGEALSGAKVMLRLPSGRRAAETDGLAA
ncbi:MAG: PAS domain-containing sensor histidine kinase [Pseudomonadota bacterium]|nr:PAS domain-containing sensor histidine kinase [Pseudomonadota bacterium]